MPEPEIQEKYICTTQTPLSSLSLSPTLSLFLSFTPSLHLPTLKKLQKLNIDLFQRDGFKLKLSGSILALKDLSYTRNG